MKISTMMLYNNITYVVDDMFLQRTLFIKNYIVEKKYCFDFSSSYIYSPYCFSVTIVGRMNTITE